MSFDIEKDGDRLLDSQGVFFLMDEKSLTYMDGSEIDFDDGLQGRASRFATPMRKALAAAGSRSAKTFISCLGDVQGHASESHGNRFNIRKSRLSQFSANAVSVREGFDRFGKVFIGGLIPSDEGSHVGQEGFQVIVVKGPIYRVGLRKFEDKKVAGFRFENPFHFRKPGSPVFQVAVAKRDRNGVGPSGFDGQ